MSRPENDLVIPKLPEGWVVVIDHDGIGGAEIAVRVTEGWGSNEIASVRVPHTEMQAWLNKLVADTITVEQYVGTYEE